MINSEKPMMFIFQISISNGFNKFNDRKSHLSRMEKKKN